MLHKEIRTYRMAAVKTTERMARPYNAARLDADLVDRAPFGRLRPTRLNGPQRPYLRH